METTIAPSKLPCPVCSQPLAIRLARGRKSGKPFVMVVCSLDARHFRGFISHRPYVRQVLDAVESRQEPRSGGVSWECPNRPPKAAGQG